MIAQRCPPSTDDACDPADNGAAASMTHASSLRLQVAEAHLTHTATHRRDAVRGRVARGSGHLRSLGGMHVGRRMRTGFALPRIAAPRWRRCRIRIHGCGAVRQRPPLRRRSSGAQAATAASACWRFEGRGRSGGVCVMLRGGAPARPSRLLHPHVCRTDFTGGHFATAGVCGKLALHNDPKTQTAAINKEQLLHSPGQALEAP